MMRPPSLVETDNLGNRNAAGELQAHLTRSINPGN